MDKKIEKAILMPHPQELNWQEQFMEDHNHCCLCGSELYMTHVTNFVENRTTEEAFCESCRVRTRKCEYNLQ